MIPTSIFTATATTTVSPGIGADLGLGEDEDLARGVRRHVEAPDGVEGKSGGPEAGVRAAPRVRVREHRPQRRRARARLLRLAVRECHRAERVARRQVAVPWGTLALVVRTGNRDGALFIIIPLFAFFYIEGAGAREKKEQRIIMER